MPRFMTPGPRANGSSPYSGASSPKNRTQHFRRIIEARHIRTTSSSLIIYHWSSIRRKLEEWCWPCDDESGARIPPHGLQDHRRTHSFRAPCCLCAYLDGEEYTEAAISIVETIPMPDDDPDRNRTTMNGEYVATCATDRCGYFISLERFYTINGIRVKLYEEREHELSEEELMNITSVEESFRGGDGLFQVMPNVMRRASKKVLEIEDVTTMIKGNKSLMVELAAGIKEQQFFTLFVQCSLCKVIMLREPFSVFHLCVGSHGLKRFINRPPPALKPSGIPLSIADSPSPSSHEDGYDTEIVTESDAESEADSDSASGFLSSDEDSGEIAAAASSDDIPSANDFIEALFSDPTSTAN
ncbi:hypothetical protein DFP72DRAFT_864736 [Ephemerocybe angulata]|uniref:Uncharacterized protein n=1 Tax=Ephemerocybe angulata TaxID=980116 RepID=A0A8H6LSB1_9AGAR|nr:hypothetical protein DFP72DRAFT_864736 [Tulosesus angulatus]